MAISRMVRLFRSACRTGQSISLIAECQRIEQGSTCLIMGWVPMLEVKLLDVEDVGEGHQWEEANGSYGVWDFALSLI